MKSSYNKSINLKCITCGDTDFTCNEDKSFIKCNRCNKEYSGGYDELVELNQETINTEFEELKSEVENDARKEIEEMLKKAFQGSKNIKLK
jgi:hypothetical protein